MFSTLIESRAARQRHPGGTAFSIGCHAALIGAALYLTYHADQAFAKPKEEQVKFVAVHKDVPKPVDRPKPPDAVVAPPPPKGFKILTAPIVIPDVIPNIDLSAAATNPNDYKTVGVPGGTADGVEGGQPRPIQSDQVYAAMQVERQAALAAGNIPPVYPSALRSGNIEGNVMASFVVDTLGRADMLTFTVLKSTHELFTDAVRAQLPRMKFIPAEVGGHKVRQLVQMPFMFTLSKQP